MSARSVLCEQGRDDRCGGVDFVLSLVFGIDEKTAIR